MNWQIIVSIDLVLFFTGIFLFVIGKIIEKISGYKLSFTHYLKFIGGVLFTLSGIIAFFALNIDFLFFVLG